MGAIFGTLIENYFEHEVMALILYDTKRGGWSDGVDIVWEVLKEVVENSRRIVQAKGSIDKAELRT